MKKTRPKPVKFFVPCLPEYEADHSALIAKSKRTTMEAHFAKEEAKTKGH